MLTLGFTDEQLEDLYEAEKWSLDEQHEIVRDAARPGGFDRIYAIYLRTGHTPDRERYFIYLADGARQFDMLPEALAILRQASNSELKSMRYRAEAPLRELIIQVQSERRPGRIKLAVALGLLSALSGTAVFLYRRRQPAASEQF